MRSSLKVVEFSSLDPEQRQRRSGIVDEMGEPIKELGRAICAELPR